MRRVIVLFLIFVLALSFRRLLTRKIRAAASTS